MAKHLEVAFIEYSPHSAESEMRVKCKEPTWEVTTPERAGEEKSQGQGPHCPQWSLSYNAVSAWGSVPPEASRWQQRAQSPAGISEEGSVLSTQGLSIKNCSQGLTLGDSQESQ